MLICESERASGKTASGSGQFLIKADKRKQQPLVNLFVQNICTGHEKKSPFSIFILVCCLAEGFSDSTSLFPLHFPQRWSCVCQTGRIAEKASFTLIAVDAKTNLTFRLIVANKQDAIASATLVTHDQVCVSLAWKHWGRLDCVRRNSANAQWSFDYLWAGKCLIFLDQQSGDYQEVQADIISKTLMMYALWFYDHVFI